MNHKPLSKRRKIAAIFTALLALALAITGTMAAFVFNAEVTNEWGDIIAPGGTGHDDFGGGDNKDVYFENYGAATLFVRIRLDEYMEFGTGSAAKSFVKSATRSNKTTWTPHVPSAKLTPEVCAPGNLETAGVDFHDYWTWKMGGAEGERYYLPTDPTSATASNVQQGAFYTIADKTSIPALQPIPQATVVTMARWVEMGSPIGNFWVVDTDGWAYWASPLAPKTVTGLLLNEVKLTTKPDQSYYYAINVRFNATDREDIANIRDDATNAGKDLLDKILGIETLDDRLARAIAEAKVALDEADANPGKYTQASYDALDDARDAGILVRDNAASTDAQKEKAIEDIYNNMPLTQVVTPPSTVLDTKTPPSTTLGFVPVTNDDPDLDHSTHTTVLYGVHEIDPTQDRWCAIALDTILDGTLNDVTVAAVDPAFASYIVKENDPNGGKSSIVFKWLPVSTGTSTTVAQRFSALNNQYTAVSNIGYDGAYAVTTSVLLTRGTQSATVLVTFYYNHSLLFGNG